MNILHVGKHRCVGNSFGMKTISVLGTLPPEQFQVGFVGRGLEAVILVHHVTNRSPCPWPHVAIPDPKEMPTGRWYWNLPLVSMILILFPLAVVFVLYHLKMRAVRRQQMIDSLLSAECV